MERSFATRRFYQAATIAKLRSRFHAAEASRQNQTPAAVQKAAARKKQNRLAGKSGESEIDPHDRLGDAGGLGLTVDFDSELLSDLQSAGHLLGSQQHATRAHAAAGL